MTTSTLAPSPGPIGVPRAVGQIRTLFTRTMIERWRSLLGWALGLVGIGVMQLTVYPSVRESAADMQSFVDAWPEALREAFGLGDYTTGPGYLNAEMFSLMIPLVMIAVCLAAAAAATAGEEERGTADLLLALPTTRGRVIVAKALGMLAGVMLLALAGFITLVVGAPIADLSVATSGLVAGFVLTGLLGLLYGSVGLLLGAVTGRRALVLGVGIGLAIAAFLLDVLAPMADWLEPWQDASPFSWALGADPLVTGIDWPMAGLLAGLTVGFTLLAWLAFSRRDIATR